MSREVSWRCDVDGRAVARIVLHDSDVYLETEGNHNGVVVFTRVRVARSEFAEKLKHLGGIF